MVANKNDDWETRQKKRNDWFNRTAKDCPWMDPFDDSETLGGRTCLAMFLKNKHLPIGRMDHVCSPNSCAVWHFLEALGKTK